MADTRNRKKSSPESAGSASGSNRSDAEGAGAEDGSAAIELELAQTKDKLLRALAEQQNIRRQMQRERDDAVKYAASPLAEDVVDTLDNLRRAIESASGDAAVKQLLSGVEATERNLVAALARHGVQRIDPLGEVFDPLRHHAVFHRPEPKAPEGMVIEVLQPGYMLHDRLLRPAMVGVAAPPDS